MERLAYAYILEGWTERLYLIATHFPEWNPVLKLWKAPDGSLSLVSIPVIPKCRSEKDNEETAFKVLGLLYECERMPFGIYHDIFKIDRQSLWW